MKYGLLIFKKTENLGDDVQSYAGKKYLPQIDYLVEREEISSFIPNEKEKVATIMNAWWIHNKFNWPPSPYIEPKMVSMHFEQIDLLRNKGANYITTGKGNEYFKKHEPIGCRDLGTKDVLSKSGIETYFSGCLTLTIEKFNDVEKEDSILLIDVDDKIYEKIKTMTTKRIDRITNVVDPKEYSNLSWEEREANVIKYLKHIQKSSLVITPRLHSALPSLALETPTLVVDYEIHHNRMKDFLPLVETATEDEFLNGTIKYDINNPRENKRDYLKIRESIQKECYEFIESVKTKTIDTSTLPDVNEYKEFVDVSTFQKNLILEDFETLKSSYNQLIIDASEHWENGRIAWNNSSIAWDEVTKLQKMIMNKQKLKRHQYFGGINTDLQNIELSKISNSYILKGEIDIATWVGDTIKPIKDLVSLTLKSSDETFSKVISHTHIEFVKYSFETDITDLDLSKNYHIEVKLLDKNNLASDPQKTQKILFKSQGPFSKLHDKEMCFAERTIIFR